MSQKLVTIWMIFFNVFSINAEYNFVSVLVAGGQTAYKNLPGVKSRIHCAFWCSQEDNCTGIQFESSYCRLYTSLDLNKTHSHSEEAIYLKSRVTCPDGYFQIVDSCYKMILASESTDAARDRCSAMGAKLAEPDTELAVNSLKTYLKQNHPNERPIFGGWDKQTDSPRGPWVWMSDHRPMTYFTWGGDNPSSTYERCLQFLPSNENSAMNDIPCSTPFSYICEKV
ncbi:tetranectin-like protein [Tubulanus polymorphus]|uniref:tetranectin-like protein n=1 Tax=Tubulanus polymorphus TaxID=672921 RepID=UPI003DA479C8